MDMKEGDLVRLGWMDGYTSGLVLVLLNLFKKACYLLVMDGFMPVFRV